MYASNKRTSNKLRQKLTEPLRCQMNPYYDSWRLEHTSIRNVYIQPTENQLSIKLNSTIHHLDTVVLYRLLQTTTSSDHSRIYIFSQANMEYSPGHVKNPKTLGLNNILLSNT